MQRQYIHGFSKSESARLIAQARVLAPIVFGSLRLPETGDLLEFGCGVGAELGIVLERWPGLKVTGLDLDAGHLHAAQVHLQVPVAKARVRLVRGNACRLPFAPSSFDSVITVWMLEHVPDPRAVLAEGLRVLRPNGRLICTEVDNSTFRFEPEQPAVSAWWSAFNRFQCALGGDPFVGRRLETLARSLGCTQVETNQL